MGVSAAALFTGQILLTAPLTDDPVVVIVIAMAVSGGLMLICGGLSLVARIRRAREAKKVEKSKK